MRYSGCMSELYKDKELRVVLEESPPLPNGRRKQAARIYRPDTVSIIAFKDPEHILLLHEYRPFYAEWIWMLPSGKIDKETDMHAAAQRELQEETGFKAAELTYLWNTNSTESIVSTNHIFVARDLSPAPLPQDEDELMEAHPMTLDEALEKVLKSAKVHTPSAYGLLRYIREQKPKNGA